MENRIQPALISLFSCFAGIALISLLPLTEPWHLPILKMAWLNCLVVTLIDQLTALTSWKRAIVAGFLGPIHYLGLFLGSGSGLMLALLGTAANLALFTYFFPPKITDPVNPATIVLYILLLLDTLGLLEFYKMWDEEPRKAKHDPPPSHYLALGAFNPISFFFLRIFQG